MRSHRVGHNWSNLAFTHVEIVWELSTESKMFRSYCSKQLTADADLNWSGSRNITWLFSDTIRPGLRSPCSPWGIHSSQSQLHSLLFFKGNVCVNHPFSTKQAAMQPCNHVTWIQVYFSLRQGVNNHIREVRGALQWGTAVALRKLPSTGKQGEVPWLYLKEQGGFFVWLLGFLVTFYWRRGRQRMRWLDNITDSTDMNKF